MPIFCRTIPALALTVLLLVPALVRADTTLEFLVKEGASAPARVQTVAIKDGRIMAKGAGGDRTIDLLFNQAEQGLKVIDHGQRTVMRVDEGEVVRLNQQVRGVQPLLQGLGEQIAKLSPEERRQWQELVGGTISLERIAKAQGPPEPIRLVASGGQRTVAGVRCQPLRVMQGGTAMAELCLAAPVALKIPSPDYATVRGLLTLYERIAAKGAGLARQLGLALPAFTIAQELGLPITLKDLSREGNGTVTLRRILTSPLSPDQMRIPAGYRAKPLTLW